MNDIDLPSDYYDTIVRAIDENGVYPHNMLVLGRDDRLTVCVFDYQRPDQIMNYIMKVLVEENPKQLIYGMDRFCKPGQGTTLGDCVAGAFWNNNQWRPFVIEYQHEPRQVKPLDWNNEFWKVAVRKELMEHFGVKS